jgi:HEAT repeat protein
MHPLLKFSTGSKPPSVVSLLLRVFLLLLPAGLLLLGCLRTSGTAHQMLWLGTAFQIGVCCLAFLSRQQWRQPIGPSVIALYLIALGWLWLGAAHLDDWYPHLAQAILLVVPLWFFSVQTLTSSGAPALRRARMLAKRLAERKDWPADLAACRSLPEVKALREAMHVDATPALNLLQNRRLEVRVAALAALEFRKNWRPGQAEYVLQLVQRAQEPPVRAAGVSALGNLDDRVLVEALATFLHDPSLEVRQAATEALLWDCEHRWMWIRHSVRRNLADPTCADDGPLRYEGQLFTPEAVADLHAWAAEKGQVAFRAAQTLGVHYSHLLSERGEQALVHDLQRQVADPKTAGPLRSELARLLQNNRLLDRKQLEKLLDPANPASLRLMAAEALLAHEGHPDARAALHDIARLPNREIALATADVVQRRLGVDLGLATGEPRPPLHSRQAAEVTRRVMAWASQQDEARALKAEG